MARKPRIEFPGAFYHVLSRGNNRQVIFQDEQDYRAYLKRLEKYRQFYKFTLYAFVLMPNHFHLLLETSTISLSKIMQGLQQSYASYFHRKYKSVGHLFQGRYKAILCQRDAYLLELVRYIHLNPVRAGLAKNPNEYLWTSHRAYLGLIKQPSVEKILIYAMLSEDKFSAEKKYLEFIQDGITLGHQDRFYEVTEQRYLGSSEFVENIKKNLENDEREKKKKGEMEFLSERRIKLPEILKAVSEITRISPESLLSESRERDLSHARSLLVFIASRLSGIRNKNLAEYLKRDPSSITNMLRRIEKRVRREPALSGSLDKIIKLLKV